MNLQGLETQTTVNFDNLLKEDMLVWDEKIRKGNSLKRVTTVLDRVRALSGEERFAKVMSQNNFPAGTGIASSASAFAALSLAASCAAGLNLNEAELSRIARLGSGSACRSVPAGFVEWQAGHDGVTSYAYSIAPEDHWNLVDCITIISKSHKATSSEAGHVLADSSQFQAVRTASATERLEICRNAILTRDFDAFADVTEFDSNLMHAVIMTSNPPVIYWLPATLQVIHEVIKMRKSGMQVCYTIDAGPNVHVICANEESPQVSSLLIDIPGVQDVIAARPGGPAQCTIL